MKIVTEEDKEKDLRYIHQRLESKFDSMKDAWFLKGIKALHFRFVGGVYIGANDSGEITYLSKYSLDGWITEVEKISDTQVRISYKQSISKEIIFGWSRNGKKWWYTQNIWSLHSSVDIYFESLGAWGQLNLLVVIFE